ncbi:MAG: hypothetical protein KatS3mg091_318 [Patescibacteria group bacterium]|nr:MAG: hypothetical protein KatS3mg091_318 [Patescibacteria group bacterium]
MKNKSKLIQILLILGITIAGSTFLNDLLFFYKNEKTILKLKGVIINNPILTPCFLGLLGFIFFLIWFNHIKRSKNKLKQLRYFYLSLIGANVFGWSNVLLEFITFYTKNNYNSCGSSFIKTPFLSPCLFGSTIFLILLFITKTIISNNYKL